MINNPKDYFVLPYAQAYYQADESKFIELCINLLNDQGIIYSGENIRKRGFKIFSYYFGNISTIPDIQQFLVIDTTSRKLVGKLDQFFIGEFGESGNTFTLKGNSWNILSIDDNEYKIFVEPLSHHNSTIPYWFGELNPIDFYTSQSVGELRSKILSNNNYQVSKDQIQIIKQEFYHENGQIEKEGSYRNQSKCGKWTTWYDNGEIDEVYVFNSC